MHAQPIATVDERVSPDILWGEWLVVVGFMAEVELRDASLGDDTAIIRLVRCQSIGARLGKSEHS